ncbi:alpha/beta fold hydrolase [Kineococcus sp. SYSU DK001]|uniref:alpha/beta fold hydrolase n=1 Tax=Kineococcus sp. SYSU DK001 TaxID=3383122 RepID=UPI003D7E72E5
MTTGTAPLPSGDGVVRWVSAGGDREPVVYLHGLGCSGHATWADTAARLGRPAVFLDLVGHGLSDRPPAFGYGLAEHADALAAALRTVTAETGEPVDLLAHSLGGSIAVLLASRHPGLLRSVVLVEPGLDVVDPGPDDIARWDEEGFLARGWDEVLAAQTPGRLAEMRTADPLAVLRSAEAIASAADGRLNELLADSAVPVLLVAGFRQYRKWDWLQRNGVRCERIDGGGHFTMLDAPRRFTDLVTGFHAGLRPAVREAVTA